MKALLILVFVFYSLVCWGQETDTAFEIYGTIMDGKTKDYLGYVDIFTSNQPTNEWTGHRGDYYGRFEIKVRRGEVLKFRHPGYDPENVTINEPGSHYIYLYRRGTQHKKDSQIINTNQVLVTKFNNLNKLFSPVREFLGKGGVFSQDGTKVLTVSGSQYQFWNTETKKVVDDTLIKPSKTKSAIFSVETKPEWVPMANCARVWDLNGELQLVLSGHSDEVTCATFSRDGNRILTGSKDGTARLWDLSGQKLSVFKGDGQSVFRSEVVSVGFSPKGDMVLTGSSDGTAKLWDLSDGLIRTLSGHSQSVTSAIFSPDGTKILTASYDTTARLWDLNGRIITTYTGHTDVVMSAVFSPDGSKVLTASRDQTAALWDLEGNRISEYIGHSDEVSFAGFSSDGNLVLTSSSDDSDRIWELKGGQLFVNYSRLYLQKFDWNTDGTKVLFSSKLKCALYSVLEKFRTDIRSLVKDTTSASTSAGKKGLQIPAIEAPPILRPYLIIENLALSGLGPNKIQEANEKPIVTATVRNLGNGPAHEITVYAYSTHPGFYSRPKTINALDPGGRTNIRIDVEPIWELKDGVQTLSLRVKDKNDYDAEPALLTYRTSSFSRPVLQIVEHQFLSDGKVIRNGQPITLHCTVFNNSTVTAKGVKVSFAVPANTMALSNASFTLGDLEDREDGELAFKFRTTKGYTKPKITIIMKVTDSTGKYTKTVPMTVAINEVVAEASNYEINPSITLTSPDSNLVIALFSPDGKKILTLHQDSAKRIRRNEERYLMHSWFVHTIDLEADSSNPQNSLYDITAQLWSLPTNLDSAPQIISKVKLRGHKASVTSAIFSPDGSKILTQSLDHTARLWDLKGNVLTTFNNNKYDIEEVEFSHDGSKLLTTIYGRHMQIYDLQGNQQATYEYKPLNLTDQVDSLNSDWTINPSTDSLFSIIYLNGKQTAIFSGNKYYTGEYLFSPDGKKVLINSKDSTVRLFDIKGNQLATFRGHEDRVWSYVFSPDGQNVLTTSKDKQARLWDLKGKCLATLSNPASWIESAIFSPDGGMILTSSYGHVRLWDLSGKCIARFKGFTWAIKSLNFSPDGTKILTIHYDDTTHIWDIPKNLLTKATVISVAQKKRNKVGLGKR